MNPHSKWTPPKLAVVLLLAALLIAVAAVGIYAASFDGS